MNVNDALFPGITYAAITAEAERELASRRRTYPDRVQKCRMTQAEADYQIAIMAAIAADTRRMGHIGPSEMAAVTHTFSWLDRRKALERELDMRDRLYPGWIANARMTQANAARQMSAMKAILWRYDCGFDWQHAALQDRQRREHWYAHWSTVFARWYQVEPAQVAML
jgi:hypothetical protein